MSDYSETLKLIKQAALDAVNASKPTGVFFGKVTSVSPLQINVEQKMTLNKKQLVLTRNVTDFTTAVTVNHNTETYYYTGVYPNQSQVDVGHKHAVAGKKTITVHNGLVVGDEVILLQMQGGQKYIVWDRIAS